jgi:hypothetical protein
MVQLRDSNVRQRMLRTRVIVELRIDEVPEFHPDVDETRQPQRVKASSGKAYPSGMTIPRTPRNGVPIRFYRYNGTGESDEKLDREWERNAGSG